MNTVSIRSLINTDWNSISKIYADGIETGIATFETVVPNWETWSDKHIESCRIVAIKNNDVVGFAVLSLVSNRHVYKGVAEVTVYVYENCKNKGLGSILLKALINESEQNGFWTLQAGIFSENKASIALHKKCGFRIVGVREKIGQRNGKWYDNQLLERRSKKWQILSDDSHCDASEYRANIGIYV